MKEIIAGLFLGSLQDVHDSKAILENNISHVLTVDSTSLPTLLQNELRDNEIAVDYVFMLDTLEFRISKALENALKVLDSRLPSSVSIVHW